ncbi:MAG: PQQ-dependent sugar dehydrogenase [Thermoflexales bacterium]|nr:PQQ-dependent sugar dehydrogenase [Thermoflexales bacterium]
MVRVGCLALAFVLAFAQWFVHPRAVSGQTGLPPGFVVELVVDNLDWPTAFTFAPDGRIFIAEKAGRVKVWKDGVLHARPVIDIRDEVNNFVDRGLIGMALDPNCAENGWIYLMYAWDAPGEAKDVGEVRRSRLVRYTLDGNTLRPNSERVLFDDHFNYTLNHSVGTLKFDREGNLWVSLGDGSLSAKPDRIALTAQQIDNLQGKILRIDPRTGAGLPGNPFFDPQDPRSARSRVWSYGYRNPFRFALHPETQLPYVGDVGWDTYEMLMIATPGSNFGWPCVEGINDLPEFQRMPECRGINAKTTTPKELSYPHNGANASVTAGDFNTGDNFPAEMKGNFFWGDYSTQKLWRTILDESGRFKESVVFAEGVGEPVDIQFGPDGALWYLSIFSRGLMRIRYTANPLKPLAQITETKPLPGPRARVLSPANGETFLGGQFVRLRGAAQNAVRSYWYVMRYDGTRATPLHSAEGTGTTFIMPSDLGDEGYIEASFTAVDAQGRTATEKVNLYVPNSDGYIRSWWLVGGYPWRTLDDDPIGEAKYVPSFDDPRAWTVRSRSHNISLIDYITPSHQDTVIAYAFVWIVSPEDRKGLLGMNSDDGIAAWLNGQRIWYNRVNRAMPDDKRDIDLPPIELKKGYNALLLKIENVNRGGDPRLKGDWRATGGWQFKARVLNPDGSIMRDIVPRLVRP